MSKEDTVISLETTYKIAGKKLLSIDEPTFRLDNVDPALEMSEFCKADNETFWSSYFQKRDVQICACPRLAFPQSAHESFFKYMSYLHSNYLTRLERKLRMLYWEEPAGYMLLEKRGKPWKQR